MREDGGEADLVVVGFGAAGAAAAITAADLGADVLLLERQPREWHTPSTRASGGQVMAVTDVEDAVRYMDRCAGGLVPVEVTRAWAERARSVVDWVQRCAGVELVKAFGAEHSEWEGSNAVSSYVARAAQTPSGHPRGGGAILFAGLEEAVRARTRIEIRYETRAARLMTDDSRRVSGVIADMESGRRHYRGRSGVVLACGGYEFNDEMKRCYLRAYPAYFYGTPMNTGDGVRMAQALGADLWHMNSMIGRGIAHFELDSLELNYLVQLPPGGYALLDRHGRRFANEYLQATNRHDFYYELINFDAVRSEYPRIPCYWVFDSRRMIHGELVRGSAAAGPYRYEWSSDSETEIAHGWLKRADSLEALFESVNIDDPLRALTTVLDYNQGCAAGTDRYDRPIESLIPIDEAPFYCMELWPGGPNTSGGPRRNECAQVVDVFGQPIQGLYEAGELGEAVGALYPANGANISDAICFGRIAAEHALGRRDAETTPPQGR